MEENKPTPKSVYLKDLNQESLKALVYKHIKLGTTSELKVKSQDLSKASKSVHGAEITKYDTHIVVNLMPSNEKVLSGLKTALTVSNTLLTISLFVFLLALTTIECTVKSSVSTSVQAMVLLIVFISIVLGSTVSDYAPKFANLVQFSSPGDK